MPGLTVKITNAPVPSSLPSESGKLFLVIQTERGSTTEPITIHSPAEFKSKCGGTVSGTYGNVGQEAFFQEGGSTLIVSRIVGSATATAKVELENSGKTKKVAVVKAKNGGTWGNELKVKIKTEETKFAVTVLEEGTEVESTKELESVKALVSWAEQNSTRIVVTETSASSEANPGEATSTLSGGVTGGVLAANYEEAFKRLSAELGTGLVSLAGVSTTGRVEELLAHCEKNNRVALVDAANEETKSGLVTVATGLFSKEGARRGILCSSWVNVPGTTPNTTRLAPFSPTYAGMVSRHDALTTPPEVNEAVAGARGIPRYIVSLTKEFTRTEQNELNENKVCALRKFPTGVIEMYGNVTLAPRTESPWLQFTASRLFGYVVARCEELLEPYVFREIDPKGIVFNQAKADLQNFLESLGNQLYNNARTAVNTGSNVNTPETIAKKEIIAAVEVKPSPSAETVVLNITAQA